MKKKWILKQAALVALCAALALNVCGALSPAYAIADCKTVYTFGDPNRPFRDLAAEHQKEVERREEERRKAGKIQAVREKADMKKAARERERKEKAEKKAPESEGAE